MKGDSEFSLQVLVMVIFAALVLFVLFTLTSGDGKGFGTKQSFVGLEIAPALFFFIVFQFLQAQSMKGALTLTAKHAMVILLIVLIMLVFLGLWSSASGSAQNLMGKIVEFFNSMVGG